MNLAAQVTLAALTRPAGGALLTELLVEGPVDLGPAVDVYFYWFETDLKLRKELLGGFLIPTLQAGWEPGWFVPAAGGARTWSPHWIARAGLVMNLRNDRFWLYDKAVGTARDRQMKEYDPYKAATLEDELSLRNDVAALVCVSRQAERVWWVYAELTLETERTWGWLDRKPRAGVLVENLFPHVSADLDVYWGLMDNAAGGPGVLALMFWSPPIP